MTNSGIYIIYNTKNGNVYIGQAVDFQRRWKAHRTGLNSKRHANQPLQNDWIKYGEHAFHFKVLEYCSVDQLTKREQHYLSVYTPKGNCYNISQNASSPFKQNRIPRFDREYSKEQLLTLLNEHKTVAAVAEIIGMSEANLFRNLQRRGFKKVVTYHWGKV